VHKEIFRLCTPHVTSRCKNVIFNYTVKSHVRERHTNLDANCSFIKVDIYEMWEDNLGLLLEQATDRRDYPWCKRRLDVGVNHAAGNVSRTPKWQLRSGTGFFVAVWHEGRKGRRLAAAFAVRMSCIDSWCVIAMSGWQRCHRETKGIIWQVWGGGGCWFWPPCVYSSRKDASMTSFVWCNLRK